MSAWTQDEHAKLAEMVAAGKPWPDIAASLGRGEGACKTRYCRFERSKVFQKRGPVPDLTPAQIEEANRLRGSSPSGKMCLRKIARIMGVRHVQLMRVFNSAGHAKRQRRDRNRTQGRDAERRVPLVIPANVLEERERAYAPMSYSRELLGDPRPGRSALDKRSAA